MLITARLSTWATALFFAAAPLILLIAKSPTHISDLLKLSSYASAMRDVIFTLIAILAIGLVDAFDSITESFYRKSPGGNIGIISMLFAIISILQIVVYTYWSSKSIEEMQGSEVYLPYIGLTSFLTALSSRLALIISAIK